MHLEDASLRLLKDALQKLDSGFAALPSIANDFAQDARLAEVMDEVATKLQDNYPYFHPLYAGQMLKPPHPVARLAYALAMWINPNNHALDGGRASSAMENEAVAQIAGMFGWKEYLGHLCGGGTMANLEALWVAGSTSSRQENCRVRSVSLHAPSNFCGSAIAVCRRAFGQPRPHGHKSSGTIAASRRGGLRCSHARNHGNRFSRSLGGNSSNARALRFSSARRFRVWRIFCACFESFCRNPCKL